ncbi:TetR/AcrR family transcriptional regulator [Rhizorhapis suberifaciens]|uniref:TetR/AcrR family transcriptional repressor of nem operon n=1 Tax=Rhizorhapis suberifaciens TaxID=13656 RepID=A0A840HY75_9SPHN|nr:TetR/AcrR family transcriptional regulator [Rhizorhapis suberifaciens]MBB4642547.1 TetR/AcrR family transcriptional repressor of nem operon [Rhizorhapis suberifaciens]
MADTRDTILAAAMPIVQARGYNGLSFRELAKVVGIKSASIHYHFPSKADLGAALVRRYREYVRDGFRTISDHLPDLGACLNAYVNGFRQTLENGNRMCLCGLLGAEYDELPDPVKDEIEGFVEDNVTWIAGMISASRAVSHENARAHALAIYAALSGAQLIARSRGDISIFDAVAQSYGTCGLLSDGKGVEGQTGSTGNPGRRERCTSNAQEHGG